MSLNRHEVVSAALAILDEYGLADLSMRRLADSLGVKAGAIYWHVANKQSLLAAVADEVLAELPAPQGPPRQALEAWATSLREVLLAHRDSAELVATALASGLCGHDLLAAPTAILAGSRRPRQARWGAAALLHLVLGHVVEEQNSQLMGRLGVTAASEPGPEGDQAFSHGVRALVAGLLDNKE